MFKLSLVLCCCQRATTVHKEQVLNNLPAELLVSGLYPPMKPRPGSTASFAVLSERIPGTRQLGYFEDRDWNFFAKSRPFCCSFVSLFFNPWVYISLIARGLSNHAGHRGKEFDWSMKR